MLQRMSQKNFTESGTEITYDNPINTPHVSRRIIARDIDLLRSHNQANERR